MNINEPHKLIQEPEKSTQIEVEEIKLYFLIYRWRYYVLVFSSPSENILKNTLSHKISPKVFNIYEKKK